MNQKNTAIFLDRDGVLIKDTHLITNINQAEIFEEAFWSIKQAKSNGFLIFLISNQAVVARGLLTKEDMEELNKAILVKVLDGNNPSEYFSKIYTCPHHPNATIENFKKDCTFRKPQNGMIIDASKLFNLDLERSWVIGDRVSDIIAGNISGCKTIQLTTGQHDSQIIQSSLVSDKEMQAPFYKATNLKEAIQYIESLQEKNL